MASKKETALGKVQDLYVLQVELWNFLDEKSTNASQKESAKKTLKEFKALLREVDWQHMGGEDVLESLQMIPTEVTRKLKGASVRKRAEKLNAKKAKATTKKVVKKPAAKKKVTAKPAKKKVVAKKVAKKKTATKKKTTKKKATTKKTKKK